MAPVEAHEPVNAAIERLAGRVLERRIAAEEAHPSVG